ncbi:MAG: hypothetical protein CMM86_07065 [Rhodovulum sp.]|mgnify:CR=1 FL=1|nr:hypothetical protein [Rhodovulum sp.]
MASDSNSTDTSISVTTATDLNADILETLEGLNVTGEETLFGDATQSFTSFELDAQDSIIDVETPGVFVDAGDGYDAVNVQNDQGVDISGLSRYSALGRELGVSSDQTGFVINERGATATIDGQEVTATYFSLFENSLTRGGELLSSTALATTTQLASVLLNVEAIRATAFNDRYFGYTEDADVYLGAGDDYLRSTGGNKTIFGEDGNDTAYIRGGYGAYYDGGEDSDFADFTGEKEGVRIENIGVFGALGRELGIGNDDLAYSIASSSRQVEFNGELVSANRSTINNNASQTTGEQLSDSAVDTALQFGHLALNVEKVRGTKFNDAFVGGNYDDHFQGGDGDDFLQGRLGDDTLDGGAGNDTLILEGGAKTIIGGEGTDTLRITLAEGSYTVYDNGDGTGDVTIIDSIGARSTISGVEFARLNDGTTVALRDLVVDAPLPPAPLFLEVEDDRTSLLEDGEVTLNVLANDSGDRISIVSVEDPENGSVFLNEDGTITYRPDADFSGSETFTYTARDNDGDQKTATVTVTVQQVNDAPVVTVPQGVTVLANTPGGITVAEIEATDVEGDALTFDIVGGNDDGLFAIDENSGTVTLANGDALDPAVDYAIDIAVSDGAATTVSTLNIDVTESGVNFPSAEELIQQTDRAFGVDDGSGSIGLTGANDYTSALPFLNLMNVSRPVNAHAPGEFGKYNYYELDEMGYLDDSGWPTDIPEDAPTLGFIFSDVIGREGTYVLRYEGEGEINLALDAEVISEKPGEIVFRHNSGTFEVQLTDTDPNDTGDYIRNISIVKEEYVDLYDSGAIFNPESLERLQDFREFRTMAWQRTIESPIETLDDLTRVDHSTYATTSGVPIEVLVALSNEAGTDLWLTIPTKANDEVVDYYAEYVRDNLDPNLKVTVEYGNELWNNGYQDTHDLRAEAVEVWGVSPEDQPAHSAYIAYKATLVAQRFNAAFDKVEDGDKPLLHHTLGSQAARPAITEYYLESEAWQINDPDSYVPVNETFDSIAIATYFGGNTITDDEERALLIEAINDPNVDANEYLFNLLQDPEYEFSIPYTAEFLYEQRRLADQYGLDLTDYEGGAHLLHFDNTDLPQDVAESLVDFYEGFYRSDFMRVLFEQIWDVWREIGDGAFMNHGSVGEPSIYGFFSFLSDLADTSPRAEFLYEQNANQPAWWEDRGGEHFQQGIIDTGTADDDLLIGTNQEDHFAGGEGNDFIIGGKGDDGIHGGAGTDRVIFSGSRADYAIYREGETVIFRGPDGLDRVVDVEIVEFQSGEVFATNDLVKPEGSQNIGPVAVDDQLTINEDARTNFTTLELTQNDSDADGGTLVLVSVEGAEHGVIRLQNDNTVLYIPDEDFVGTDTFTYTVSDGNDTTTATATITIVNQLDAPDVVSEHLVVFTQDSGVGKALYQVQASDLDGDTLSYAIVGGNDDGLFTIDAETGVISSTGVLKPDAAVIAETFDLTVAVSDGTFTTESAITIEVQDDANILVEEAQTGQLLNGELGGNDLLQLTAQDGQGRYVGTLNQFNATYTDLETINNIDDLSPYAYTVYTRGFTGEVDGEVVTVDGLVVRSGLETALQFGNVVTNVEGISGTEFRDDIYGNTGDELLLGQGGNDILSGSDGDDTLNGGIGNDSLTGGAGADTFVIDDINSTDRINDFSAEQGDQIDISALLLNYDAATDDLTDYVTLGVNQFNQQTIEVSINGDGTFTDVARFQSTEFRTTLEELLDSDSLFLG